MADKVPCPICGTAADGGYHIGDSTVFKCPQCGGYRLAGTVSALFEKSTPRKPDPKAFLDPVRRKRGNSRQYPVIIPADPGGETSAPMPPPPFPPLLTCPQDSSTSPRLRH